ncbi:MAG TPA: DUF4147 domain-containing protein [Allosphingosinicella sp.]|nr:DUF4147 domain-containing protein [Allosphingosinicella sp.]
MTPRQALEAMFRAGVHSCVPRRVLPPRLPKPPPGRTIVLAVGKAAAGMAEVVEESWDGALCGVAVAPHGIVAASLAVELITAGHPIPDAASVAAGERLLMLADEAGPDDLVLVLLSGGASALAAVPVEGVTLAEKQELTQALLRSGAPIADVNCVRRHLSRIKGGRLGAAAQPARLVTLAISDVAGDRPEDIGSGPTVADPTTAAAAEALLRSHSIPRPSRLSESVKPHETARWRSRYEIVASAKDSVDAAAAEARRLGYRPQVIAYEATGDAGLLANRHAALALESRARTALISGGELTVAVTGCGQGGRNRHYALALAIALGDSGHIHALAADTDGVDGVGRAAGAYVHPQTLQRAARLGIDPVGALAACDSGSFFEALGDAIVTGPTGTNVNDLRIILIDP